MVSKKSGSGRGGNPPRQPPETLPGLELVEREEREPTMEDELRQAVRTALRSREPMDLLALVSGLVAILDPRSAGAFETSGEAQPQQRELVDALIGQSSVESTAVLTVMKTLIADDLLRSRISRELLGRRHQLPPWLPALEHATLDEEVWRITYALGDDDVYLCGLRLPTGYGITAVIYVDILQGGVVDDVQIAPEPLDELLPEIRAGLDQDRSIDRFDPATARVILSAAVELGSDTTESPESESWPMSRPVIEWMLRMLPAGGTAPAGAEWSERDTARLADAFFASPYGADLADHDHRGLLQNLLWYGTQYGIGDPLRWSESAAQILLLDWFPRKVLAEPDFLVQLPDLLRAYVRFAHDRSGIRAGLTDLVLARIDEVEPAYRQRILSTRSTPHEMLSALLGAQGVDAGALGRLGLTLSLIHI